MLFVFLIFGLHAVPAATGYWDAQAWLYAVLSLTVIRLLAAAVSLAVPAIVSMWLERFVQINWLPIIGKLCGIVFVILITIAILSFIFSQKGINVDIIAGAIVAYLLMALMWSLLYGVAEASHPA